MCDVASYLVRLAHRCVKMCLIDVMPFTDASGERKETLGSGGAMLGENNVVYILS